MSSFVGYWVQSSNNREIMCSQASNTIINCVWTNDSGRLTSHNVTILGMSLYLTSDKGNYTGNGVITWETGDEWTKLGKIFCQYILRVSIVKKCYRYIFILNNVRQLIYK